MFERHHATEHELYVLSCNYVFLDSEVRSRPLSQVRVLASLWGTAARSFVGVGNRDGVEGTVAKWPFSAIS